MKNKCFLLILSSKIHFNNILSKVNLALLWWGKQATKSNQISHRIITISTTVKLKSNEQVFGLQQNLTLAS